MPTLSRPGRLALGVFLPAPLFVALALIASALTRGDGVQPWHSPGGAVFVFLYGSFMGCLVVGLPAGFSTLLVEHLHDRGVGWVGTLVVGSLLGLGCGALALGATGVVATGAGTLTLSAIVGLVLAGVLRALREPVSRAARGATPVSELPS